MKSGSFLRQFCWTFFSAFSASEASEPLNRLHKLSLWLALLRPPLCQLLTATEIMTASVFSTVAAGLCPSQLVRARAQRAGWARLSIMLLSAAAIIHRRPPLSAALPPRASLLLNYQCWHCWITFSGTSRTTAMWRFKCVFYFFQGSSGISAPGSGSLLAVKWQPRTKPESSALNVGWQARKEKKNHQTRTLAPIFYTK